MCDTKTNVFLHLFHYVLLSNSNRNKVYYYYNLLKIDYIRHIKDILD